MPKISKKIIQHINKNNNFTRGDLLKNLSSSSNGKKKKLKNKKKKARRNLSKKDISTAEDLLRKLVNWGFLKKRNNIYKRINSLTLKGKIQINTTGNAVFKTPEDDQIMINKKETGDAFNNDNVSVSIIDYKNGFFWGRVNHVLQRGRDLCMARIIKIEPGIIYYTLLDTPGEIQVCSDDSNITSDIGDVALVKLGNGTISNSPACEVIRAYKPDDESSDFTRIVTRHSLPGPHIEYTELQDATRKTINTGQKKRKDYTDLLTVTIDGEEAKDFDDAISIKKEDGIFTLFVHIADVSYFVKKGTQLDIEALSRGTSYYLGNRVIPMLPEILSNDLCSLREGVDRQTLSAKISFDRDGNIQNHEFNRGVIKVDRRLTYVNAEHLLNNPDGSDLSVMLHEMNELKQLLFTKRINNGSLDLTLADVKLVYEKDTISEIKFAERLNSHRIIEEFMLIANQVVARSLKDHKAPSLYRVHESISQDSLISLKDFLKRMNIGLKISGRPGVEIQKVLTHASGKDIEHVINLVVLKSLMQAYYGIVPEGHFGLGFTDYTHFTSPIRRYPDLIVHRCIKSLIDGLEPPYSTEQLIAIGEKSSELERIAQKAERDMVKLKSCRIMQKRVSEKFKVIVNGVSKFGFYVTLQEMPVEGMVPLWSLTDDYYLINEDEYTVIGRKYGKRFSIGDLIEVKLSNVDIDRMIIDFEIS